MRDAAGPVEVPEKVNILGTSSTERHSEDGNPTVCKQMEEKHEH